MKQQVIRVGAVDGMRGVAAICVAFVFHWPQLSVNTKPVDAWFLSSHLMHWIQIYGWLGVDLFFLLSGFIFSYKYGDDISSRKVDGYEFFIRRFSRLYPLHLVTLIVVAAISWTMFETYGYFPLYGILDTYHLALNLVFAQYIGLESGYSFNGPAWSLSLEAVCYIVFFLVCRHSGKNRALAFIVMLFLGASLLKLNLLAIPLISQPFCRALSGFFAGCMIAAALNGGALFWLRWVALGTLAYDTFSVWVLGSVWAANGATFYLSFDLVIFPSLLICCLGFAPLRIIFSSPPFQYFGDISFSIYLIHAVIQMIFIFVAKLFHVLLLGTSFSLYIFYVVTVIISATIVHIHFELPAQSWLRLRLSRSGAATIIGGSYRAVSAGS